MEDKNKLEQEYIELCETIKLKLEMANSLLNEVQKLSEEGFGCKLSKMYENYTDTDFFEKITSNLDRSQQKNIIKGLNHINLTLDKHDRIERQLWQISSVC